MRIVLDTSVLIAAFYQPFRGPSFSKEVYDYMVENESVFLSPDILKEFRRKCSKKLNLSEAFIGELVSLLQRRTQTVPLSPTAFERVPATLRDPNDRHLLALTETVQADLLLTWDKDLLVLEKAGTARILTPRQFWDEVGR